MIEILVGFLVVVVGLPLLIWGIVAIVGPKKSSLPDNKNNVETKTTKKTTTKSEVKSSFLGRTLIFIGKIVGTVVVLIIACVIGFFIIKTALNFVGGLFKNSTPKTELPYSFSHDYTLSKAGDFAHVEIPMGYNCDYDGHGKKYYVQSEGCSKQLIGGGLPYIHQSDHSSYFDLSFYKESVVVTCTFTRIN